MIAFGPVPSRRLGQSLGINNIPPKVCTYSCVYCQVGRTNHLTVERHPFYDTGEIFESVREQVKRSRKKAESIDYLTFVPDGEPTLDINLGHEIDRLKTLGIKIAVITSGSLINRRDVQEDLLKADWVSLKFDAIHPSNWRKINRPHRELELGIILEGMLDFSRIFSGELVVETMLLNHPGIDINGVKAMANFLSMLKPARVYLAIPTRPPAETWVGPPLPQDLNAAFQLFDYKIGQVEYLIGDEGNAFAFTGSVEKDLLSITAVHPMRRGAVREFLKKADANWPVVEQLISQGKLVETRFEGRRFYLRNLNHRG